MNANGSDAANAPNAKLPPLMPSGPQTVRAAGPLGAQRPIPDFFIVGAPKCGTSSLHQYLRQHPDVFLPAHKDVPYFGSDLQHSIPTAPSSLEDFLSWFAPAPAGARIGDSCTLYMQSRRAAAEIAQRSPDASIIVMLRDPVDLIFSLHSHDISMTEEDVLDFETAVAAEPEQRDGMRVPKRCRFPQGLWYRDVAALGDRLARYSTHFRGGITSSSLRPATRPLPGSRTPSGSLEFGAT